MPNRLMLEVGQTTISVPIKLTAVQLRAVVRRYALTQSIDVESLTEVEIGEAVLRSLLRHVRDGSMDRQRMEAIEAQRAALEATLQTDNDLFDEPVPTAPIVKP
jgi:hypothetical protein